MTTAEQILKAARAEIGVREVPLGSNTGPKVREYQNTTWFAGTSYWPWCVAFSWTYIVWGKVLRQKCPYPTASVAQLEKWARDNKNWYAPGPPKPGDLACLDHGAHVTIVSSVALDGQTFSGLGGNQSNMVCVQTYATRRITTLVRVPLALHSGDDSLKPKPAPIYEVVRGEGSKARVVFKSKKLQKSLDAARRLLNKGATGVRIKKRPPK